MIDIAGIEKAHSCSWMVGGVVNSYNANRPAPQNVIQEYLTQIVVQHCSLAELRRVRVKSPSQNQGRDSQEKKLVEKFLEKFVEIY